MLSVEVIKSALPIWIQDAGRSGHSQWAIPPSGYFDYRSADVANALVGNQLGHPLFELGPTPTTLHFDQDAYIAATGSSTLVKVDNTEYPAYQAIRIKANQTLEIPKGPYQRTYLAIQGEWKVDKWLGSCSPLQVGSQIWPSHNLLRPGESITISTSDLPSKLMETVFHLRPIIPKIPKIRILPGPEWEQFPNLDKQWLLDELFKITTDSNRMGIRFEPKANLIPIHYHPEMISCPVTIGMIQLDKSGKPIIIGPDGQTVGGYPRIAQVIWADMPIIAQCNPGQFLQFILTDLDTAYSVYQYQKRKFLSLFTDPKE